MIVAFALAALLGGPAEARKAPPGDEGVRPPTHVRAVALPPERLSELDDRKRRLRVWWDADPDSAGGAVVEAVVDGQWVIVAEDASPGAITRRLEPGARVRVRWAGGVPSDPVAPERGLGPAGVAALSGRGLSGVSVADIAATEDGAWAALLEGGLARVDAGGFDVEHYGAAEGLPSDVVNAVATDGENTWVGTSAGLARLRDGVVDRVWTKADGLPDDWVQAVAAIDDPVTPGAWVGTYRGLARVRGGVEQILTPWSVFSFSGVDAIWVGYAGLRTLPDGELLPGVGDDLNVWDVDRFEPRVYLATDTEGILRLEEGLLTPWWLPEGGAVYALERDGGRLWAAAGEGGLVALSDADARPEVWGRSRGLPSDVVYEVVARGNGKLWVGTAGGLALAWPAQSVIVPWPVAPAAAGRGVSGAWAGARGALLATDDGVAPIGRVPRRWREALAAPGPVVDIIEDGDALWVIGPWDAWLAEGGRLRRVPLSAEAHTAALVRGTLWIGGPGGVHYYDARQDRFVSGPSMGAVSDLAAAGDGLWMIEDGWVARLPAGGALRRYLQAGQADCIAVAAEGVWVGGAAGLSLLEPGSDTASRVEGYHDPVMGLTRLPDGRVVAALADGSLVQARGLTPLPGTAAAADVGAVRALGADAEGRLWALGDLGAFVLSDP